jgi:hypothetical protein
MADMARKGRAVTQKGDAHWTRLYPERRPLGQNTCNAKATPELVIEIRRLHREEGLNYIQIGKVADLTPANIGKIIRRELWAHIPETN